MMEFKKWVKYNQIHVLFNFKHMIHRFIQYKKI